LPHDRLAQCWRGNFVHLVEFAWCSGAARRVHAEGRITNAGDDRQKEANMIPTRMACLGAAMLAVLSYATVARAEDVRIAIIQAQAGDARKYQPLLDYLARSGIAASFVAAPDYRGAAEMFAKGSVDAMFGGSGVAGTMIIKGLAAPVVRPIGIDGVSTYHAVVVAPRGSPAFSGAPGYFAGKRVIFSALASAGEFFFHSVGRSRPSALLRAASHGAAIDALARGQADVAIVKNHVWNKEKGKYPSLEAVGEDSGENPDGTLILSKKLAPTTAREIAAALLALEGDASPAAVAARDSLRIRGFVAATEKDFAHTLALLRKAGVTRDFAFAF
jgi:ABC-type phosphate/phosphonate transport system substrate-binding protein